MKAIITLLALIVANSAQAMLMCETPMQKRTGAPCYTCDTNNGACSIYPMGTNKDKVYEYCKILDEDVYVESQCPMMQEADEAGYMLKEIGHDHGAATSLYFEGKQLDLGIPNSMQLGKVHQFKAPEGFSGAWADWGTASSVYEYRYSKKQGGPRIPHALIYRRNFRSWLQSDTDFTLEWQDDEVTSAMFVIQLAGPNTKLVAAIDSIAADQAGEDAGKIARLCADSLVNKADNKNCQKFALDISE